MNQVLVNTGVLYATSLVMNHIFLRKQPIVNLLIPNIVERSLIEPIREAFARTPSIIKHSFSAVVDNGVTLYLMLFLYNHMQLRSWDQVTYFEKSFQIQGAVMMCHILHGLRLLILRSNLPLVQYLAPSYTELEVD